MLSSNKQLHMCNAGIVPGLFFIDDKKGLAKRSRKQLDRFCFRNTRANANLLT